MKRSAAFDALISGVSSDVFYSEYLEKKPLYISRSELDTDFYSDLLTIEQVTAYLSRTDLVIPLVRVTRLDKCPPISEYTTRQYIAFGEHYYLVDPERLAFLFQTGHSIVLAGIHPSFPPLFTLFQHLTQACGDVTMKAVFTPSVIHSTSPHFDGCDVAILQIHGSKRWDIYENPGVFPANGAAVDITGLEPSFSVLMKAGDFLYLPRGCVHHVYTQDSASFHIQIGLRYQSIFQLMDTIACLSVDDPRFRVGVHSLNSDQIIELSSDLIISRLSSTFDK